MGLVRINMARICLFATYRAMGTVDATAEMRLRSPVCRSVGFLARTNVRNVGNYEAASAGMNPMSSGKTNGDLYGVASKVVPLKHLALVLSGGVRGTDAELWGMGGNAPNWQARAFGAVAFAFTGPGKSSIIFGSEVAQQPHHPYGFDGAHGTLP